MLSILPPYARRLLLQELNVSQRDTENRATSQMCVTQLVIPSYDKGGRRPKGAQLKTFSRVVMINNLLIKVELLLSPTINVEKVPSNSQ